MSSAEKAAPEEARPEEAPSQTEAPKPMKPTPGGTNLKYQPGEKIEAKNFDGKWYPAQISEIDWNEKEILVHFEKCDEWIQMDSSRLRHLTKPLAQQAVSFEKGEEVIAPWSSTRKYPATIQSVHADGKYDVLFHDGTFRTKLPGQKIAKVDSGIRNDIPNLTNIGTKEERRERKRKINIAELFHINKRSKKKGLVHSKSPDVKTYPVNRSRVKKTLPSTGETEATDAETEGALPDAPATPKQPEAKPTTNVTPAHNMRNFVDTVPCTVEVTYKDGRTETWSKHLYQRSEGRTAGKLDIVIMNPQGKKFRCRNEIMKYCEENKINYSPEAFDFSAKGRPKSKPVVQTPPAPIPESPQTPSSQEMEKPPPHKKPRRKSQHEEPVPVTLVAPPAPVPVPQLAPLVEIPQEEGKIFIGDIEVQTDCGKLICPVKGCAKHFRRENLLHMHMKHYHPEFSKFLDYTPSVTDLAYARTVGSLDSMDGPQQASRKSIGIEKTEKSPMKSEASRKSVTPAADVVKESKKSAKALEPKTEPKAAPSTVPVVAPPIVEERSEESKSKAANDVLELSKNSSQMDSLPPTSPINRISHVEESHNEQEADMAQHSLPVDDETKSLHQKHKHKKSGRYQGPFSDHNRKRKYSLLAERRKSNYKMARKESQAPPPLPPPPAPPASTSSSAPPHPVFDDQSNSNASSQPFPVVARYQKQQSLVSNEISDHTEGTEDSKSPLTVENDKVEKLRRNEIINCICGLMEEDGLMIQCDLCLCWQHGHCANILRDTDVPDKYICSICKNPFRGRLSMKYLNDQEWLKEGTLPSLSFRSKREDVINARKAVLKRSYDLSGSISLLSQVIYTLRVKLNIAEKKDHPKLWLWAKKWSEKKFNNKLKDQDRELKGERLSGETNGDIKIEGSVAPEEPLVPKAPEPEAPIDSAECRLNLLDHLIHYQTLIDARLSCIESLAAELESVQEDAMDDETPDEYPRTKATVQMLLRDLNTVKKIAAIS